MWRSFPLRELQHRDNFLSLLHGFLRDAYRDGRYLADDHLAQQRHAIEYTGLAIVFRGWELARREAVT